MYIDLKANITIKLISKKEVNLSSLYYLRSSVKIKFKIYTSKEIKIRRFIEKEIKYLFKNIRKNIHECINISIMINGPPLLNKAFPLF